MQIIKNTKQKSLTINSLHAIYVVLGCAGGAVLGYLSLGLTGSLIGIFGVSAIGIILKNLLTK